MTPVKQFSAYPINPDIRRSYNRIFQACLILVTILVLLISFWTNDDYIVKLPFLVVGVLAITGVWLFGNVRESKIVLAKTPLDIWVVAFALAVIIATVLSIDRQVSFWGQYTRYEGLVAYLAYFLVYFLAARTVWQYKQMDMLAKIASILAASTSAYALLQYFGYDFLPWVTINFESSRAFAVFGNPVMLGGFLTLTLPFSIFTAFSSKSESQPVWFGLVALNLLGIMITFTRSSWLGGSVAAVLWIVLCRKQLFSSKRVMLQIASLLVIVILGAVFFSSRQMSVSTTGERLVSIFETAQGSAASRIEIWKGAASAIQEKPVFGSGPDTFALAFSKHMTAVYARQSSNRTRADNAHNVFLQLGATVGVVGLVLFIGIIAVFLRMSVRELKKAAPNNRLYPATFLAAMVGFIIHMTFAVGDIPTNALFWLILGAAAGTSADTEYLTLKKTPARTGVEIASLCAVAVAIVFVGFSQGKSIVADANFAKASMNIDADNYSGAQASFNKAVDYYPRSAYYQEMGISQLSEYKENPADQHLLNDAISSFLQASELAPLDVDNQLLLANAYRHAAQIDGRFWPLALKELDKAEKLEPLSADVQMHKGIAYALQGKNKKALNSFNKAVRLDPNRADIYANMAVFYDQTGNEAKARELYEKSLKLDPTNITALNALSGDDKTDE